MSDTYNVSDVMVDVFKEAVSLGEGGAAILDQVERTKFSKRRKQLLHLVEREGERDKKNPINF